jgi:hypothetical protein
MTLGHVPQIAPPSRVGTLEPAGARRLRNEAKNSFADNNGVFSQYRAGVKSLRFAAS